MGMHMGMGMWACAYGLFYLLDEDASLFIEGDTSPLDL